MAGWLRHRIFSASRWHWNSGSVSVAPTLCGCWKESRDKWASRPRSGRPRHRVVSRDLDPWAYQCDGALGSLGQAIELIDDIFFDPGVSRQHVRRTFARMRARHERPAKFPSLLPASSNIPSLLTLSAPVPESEEEKVVCLEQSWADPWASLTILPKQLLAPVTGRHCRARTVLRGGDHEYFFYPRRMLRRRGDPRNGGRVRSGLYLTSAPRACRESARAARKADHCSRQKRRARSDAAPFAGINRLWHR